MGIPPIPLLTVYGLLAIAPLILIILKKDLVNGLLLWFFLVLFGFGTLPLPMLPDISPDRMIWLALFLIFFSEIALKQRKILSGDMKIEIAMILLCVYILFSMIIAGTIYKEGHGIALNTFLSGYVVPFSIFFLAKNIVDDDRKIKKIFIFFVIVGFYLGITGIFEHFKLNYLVFPSYIMYPGVGTHWGRARGPFVQASVNGTVLGVIFFIAFYLLFQKYKKWVRIFFSISIIFMLAALLFTYTRACWLAFLLASLVIPVFFPRMRKMFMASVLAMLIVIFTQFSLEQFKTSTHSESRFFERDTSTVEEITERVTSINPIYSRINLYGASWRMFREKPFFGFGFNTFQEVSPQYFSTIKGIPYMQFGLNSHDTLSGVLVELGLVGLSFIVFIIFYILKISTRLYYQLPPGVFSGKGLVAIFWGVSIVFFINIQFIEMKLFQFPNALFFLMVGIIVGLYQRQQMTNYKAEKTEINKKIIL